MSFREFDLIDRYFSSLNSSDKTVICGIGDDAAVLDISPEHFLLVSVDTLVKDVHFSADTDAADIAYKSLAVNISDIAAMGGTARWATLALTMPELDHDWLQAFANGFSEIAERYHISLVGGDTTQGPLAITIQIMGSVTRGQSIRRNKAQVGDLVYVSGALGSAGLAYQASVDEKLGQYVSDSCTQRLHRPEPRVELGKELYHFAHAAIDVSDGLVSDLGHLLKASEVGAEIDLHKIPVCPELAAVNEEQRWSIALAAGDDYELCFTITQASEAEMQRRLEELDYPVTCIGRITEGAGIAWLDENGEKVELNLEGYQHF
jgi:thiamine-monophosphate kinase